MHALPYDPVVRQVAAAPPVPVLVFDGRCAFCTCWAVWMRRWTGTRVEYVPFQLASVHERFPEVALEQFAASVKLVQTDGRVRSGAAAIFHGLAQVRGLGWLAWLYDRVPGLAPLAEAAYRFVAHRRGRLARFFHCRGWFQGASVPLARR